MSETFFEISSLKAAVRDKLEKGVILLQGERFAFVALAAEHLIEKCAPNALKLADFLEIGEQIIERWPQFATPGVASTASFRERSVIKKIHFSLHFRNKYFTINNTILNFE